MCKENEFSSSNSNRDQPYDRKAYKNSEWAETIDAIYQIVVAEGLIHDGRLPSRISGLADWADWMVKEGHGLSNLEIAQKCKELLPPDHDYQLLLQRMIQERQT